MRAICSTETKADMIDKSVFYSETVKGSEMEKQALFLRSFAGFKMSYLSGIKNEYIRMIWRIMRWKSN